MSAQVLRMVTQAGPLEHYETTPFRPHYWSRPTQSPVRMNSSSAHGGASQHVPAAADQRQGMAENSGLHRPRASNSPPSTLNEEHVKPSLPSISTLLNVAGRDALASNGSRPSSSAGYQDSPRRLPHAILTDSVSLHGPAPGRHSHDGLPHNGIALPPTPPLRPGSADVYVVSPTASSTRSSFSNHLRPTHLRDAINNVDPNSQRQPASSIPGALNPSAVRTPDMKPSSLYMGANSTSWATESHASSPYSSSPGAASTRSFYSADGSLTGPPGLEGQRPLPSSFPPHHQPSQIPRSAPIVELVYPAGPPDGRQSPYDMPAHAHQHHHYISASSAGAFHQSQDRYVCPTCNKAFSRPSSLRIHSHSHTGEKPFMCPNMGCGKSFSVRSNMKRHERGCHLATATRGIM